MKVKKAQEIQIKHAGRVRKIALAGSGSEVPYYCVGQSGSLYEAGWLVGIELGEEACWVRDFTGGGWERIRKPLFEWRLEEDAGVIKDFKLVVHDPSPEDELLR